MAKYRILSLDGGPAAPTYLRYLETLERDCPGLLSRVDMFAGTSAGAAISALLARSGPQGRDIACLGDAKAMNEEMFRVMNPRRRDQLRVLSGMTTMSRGRDVQRALGRWLGKDTKLGDVPTDLSIVTFRVGAPDEAGMLRPLRPRIFNNHVYIDQATERPYEDPDRGENLVEVVVRSSAFPVIMPVWNGYIDGGIFANNPAMCGLSQVLPDIVANTERDDGRRVRLPKVDSLDDVVVLSLGGDIEALEPGERKLKLPKIPGPMGGVMQRSMAGVKRISGLGGSGRSSAMSWGWLPWLAMPSMPGLIFELLINASARGTHYQVRKVLGDRAMRLAVPSLSTVEGLALLMMGRGPEVIRRAESAGKRWAAAEEVLAGPTRRETRDWIERVWMSD